MQKKVWIGFIVLLVLISTSNAQSKKSQWVDSVFSTLDLSGKIGQLLMVPVNSYSDQQTLENAVSQVKKYKIGGLVFTKGGPVSQAKITNYFQHQTSVPLLIGMNAEEGPGSVLDGTVRFPSPIMLGSIRDDSLLFFLGAEIGKQLKELGVHVNFAPTSDLSTSPETEPLLYSSYGENKDKVATKVAAYQNGLQSAGILSVAKHYPFGEAPNDSSTLFPLQKLFENGSIGVVTAYRHDLIFPDQRKIFSSKQNIISNAIPTLNSADYLKRHLNFKGIVFSFIPDVQTLNKKFKPGDAELFAFKAGNDVLLFPQNIGATVRRMRRSIRKNTALQKQLNESIKKILNVKFDAGLDQKAIIKTENLLARINTPASSALQSTLFESCVTVVKDDQQSLPVKQLDNLSFASVSIGERKENTLTSYLSKYTPFTHYQLQIAEDTIDLVQNLRKYSVVVAAIYPNASGIENTYPSLLQKISEHSKVIAVNFDSPAKLRLTQKLPTVIQVYTDDVQIQHFIPQLLFGAKKADGTLPVSINENIRQGQSIQTSRLERMGYSTPEAEGLDSKALDAIAKIANEAIVQKAAPGCQILVARHGKIIYEKSFGWQTYENKIPVNDQTIYDLASVSKVVGTLQAVMFLQEKELIDIYKKASVYLPELSNTNKKDIILKDILTHQSGLLPFLLMWPQTVKGDTLLQHYYSSTKNENYPLQVAPDMFASKAIQDSIWQWVLNSEMLNKPPRTPYSPRYSDLGFMILHRLVERLVNQPMEDFLSQNLYEPIGSGTVGYLPLTKFPSSQIAPTEMDTIFRKSTIIGTVHDERAAMLGGVAGHAGLFGSATDLIKIGQMLLQKGSYGNLSFYKPETVDLFAQKQFESSTRGLGWAKSGDPNSPSSRFISPKAFGHTGFTGTCIWVDPEFDLVFVFLSNSRFPDRSGKLNSINIRSRIQDVIYQSIFNYCQYGSNHPDAKLMQYLIKANN